MKYLLSAASLLSLATAAQADIYQATTWLEPGHILTEYAYDPYLADIKAATSDAIEFELYTSGALVPAPTTLGGVGDGVTVARKGAAKLVVEVAGKASHAGSDPDKGVNALLELANQLQLL